jgi:hypothetical protein
MYIDFQLTAMAPKGSSKGKGKTRANMLKLVINQLLSLVRDRIKGFISEHICGLLQIYNVCVIMDESARDLFYDIIVLDPVMTCHL